MTDLATRPETAAGSTAAADLVVQLAAVRLPLPCVYCRMLIPAADFVFVPPASRLVATRCPGCERRITLAVTTWLRWSAPPGDDHE